MADVFISYAREDRPQADYIARELQAMGLEVFWDTEIPPGQTWSDYIEGKLSQCSAVIVLWSQHSTKSQWVREEARIGRDKSKLIPAMIDTSPAPFGFGEVQAADLSAWRGEADHPEWRRFSRAVFTAARGEGAAPPQPQQPQQPQAAAAPQPQPGWSAAPQAAAAMAGPAPSADAASMSPIDYVKKCFRLYFNGKGRARRAEYWWWILFSVLVAFVAGVIDFSFGVDPFTGAPNSQVLSMVSSLALMAPGISVTSRRLHDIGMSGWLVAGIIALAFFGAMLTAAEILLGVVLTLAAAGASITVGVIPSKPGPNQYGPNPKNE